MVHNDVESNITKKGEMYDMYLSFIFSIEVCFNVMRFKYQCVVVFTWSSYLQDVIFGS